MIGDTATRSTAFGAAPAEPDSKTDAKPDAPALPVLDEDAALAGGGKLATAIRKGLNDLVALIEREAPGLVHGQAPRTVNHIIDRALEASKSADIAAAVQAAKPKPTTAATTVAGTEKKKPGPKPKN